MTEKTQGVKESVICKRVGLAVIAFSVIVGFTRIFLYGKTGRRLDGSDLDWSWPIVANGIEQIIWGCITGYILMKIASILRYHERKAP